MTRAAAAVPLLLVLLAFSLWIVPWVPLLAFAALLVAVALDAAARPLMRHGIGRVPALGLVLLALLGALAGFVLLYADPLAEQARSLAEELPRSLAALRARLEATRWGAWLMERIGDLQPGTGDAAGTAASVAGGVLGALGDAAFVAVTGFFLALDPRPYRSGALALVAPKDRDRADIILLEAARALRGWLGAQLLSMAFVGITVGVGLSLLGVPLAPLLGVIAFLLGFIPVVGPVLAAVPGVALAAAQDPQAALPVIALYVAVQVIEGNVVTPIAQAQGANLPPALLLVVQFAAGALFGLLGVALAAPAAALGLVLIRRGYVEAWLERAPRP